MLSLPGLWLNGTGLLIFDRTKRFDVCRAKCLVGCFWRAAVNELLDRYVAALVEMSPVRVEVVREW
jgi:hypothetical protein